MSKKPSVPSNIQKELQRTAALYCYNMLPQTGMKERDQQQHMMKYFHGTANIISQAELIAQGKAEYSDLFETIENDPSVSNTTPTTILRLKPIVCRTTKAIYLCDEHITAKLVKNKTNKPSCRQIINGRALLTQAKLVMKNLKKAISIAETWTKRNGGSLNGSVVNYGSGRTVEDLYNAVLDEMFLILSCDVDDTATEDSNDEGDNITSKRSNEWFFQGFFAFTIFTKFSMKINGGEDIECLTSCDVKKDNKKNANRSSERKAMLEMKNEERVIDLTGERGVSIETKLMMKSIAIQERESELNEHATKINITMERVKAVTKEMEMALQIAMKVSRNVDEKHPRWIKYFQLEDELNDLKKSIAEQENKLPAKRLVDEIYSERIKSESSKSSKTNSTKNVMDFGKKDDNLPSTPIQLDMSNETSFELSDTPNVSNMTRL